MAEKKFNFIEPFKDIPKAIMGFPKNFIHCWKDPVKNSEEVVKRRKEIMPLLYLFLIDFILFLILYVLIPPIQTVFMILYVIGAVGALACGFMFLILKKAAEKFADIECNNCKTMIEYNDDVKIEEISKKFTITTKDKTINDKNGVPVQATVTAIGKEHTVFEITCRCQECGEVKTFRHEFVTTECEKGAVRVPYVSSGALLVQFQQEVRDAYNANFGGATTKGTLSNGVELKYKRTPQDLVKGYFGNEIQMR